MIQQNIQSPLQILGDGHLAVNHPHSPIESDTIEDTEREWNPQSFHPGAVPNRLHNLGHVT